MRCRPPNEKERGQVISVQTGPGRDVHVTQKLVHGKEISKTFSFDQVYGPNTTQKELFCQSMKPIVDEVLAGYNCTIFAYGQTSTGKTYTMEGDRGSRSHGIIDSKAGVIQRSVSHIFQTLDANNAEYTIKVSCLELYNEELQDLLSQDDSPPSTTVSSRESARDRQERLRIFEDKDGKGTLVHGLEEVIVRDVQHILTILDQASRRRQIAETMLNKQSSRSHVVTTITIHIRESVVDGEEVVKTGKLNLVDLAGSENIGRSGALDRRAKEAGMINQSLLTLGRVITSLCNHQPHVPYRESKLTRLLQDSLGGKTKTCIIATISPSVTCLEETLSTLDYAHRAKNIHNKPEVNMKIAKGALIKEMATDMEKLKAELQMQRDRAGGVFMSQEAYDQREEALRQQSSHIEMQEQKIEALSKELEEMNENNSALSTELSRVSDELEKTQQDLSEARDSINALELAKQELESKIREHEFVYIQTKQTSDLLFEEASLLLGDLHDARQSEVLLQDKIARHSQVEAENDTEKGSFRQEMLNSLDSMKQRTQHFLELHTKKYQTMAGLLESQQNQQKKLYVALEQQSRKMIDTVVNEHIGRSLKQQIVDQQYATKQGCSLTTHSLMLDQFKASLSDHSDKVKSTLEQWSSQFDSQVQEQNRTLSQLCQDLENRTTECQQELHRFLEQQLSRLEKIEEGVIKEYAVHELQRFERERTQITELQKQFQARHNTLRQQLIQQFTSMVEQQSEEHQQQIETLVNNMTGSLTKTESNLKTDMLVPLQKIISQDLRTMVSCHLDSSNNESMLHKLDQEIGKRLLSRTMRCEVNANRFGSLQDRLNKTIIDEMLSSDHTNILSDHVPKLQQSVENQRLHLSEMQRDFSSKMSDIAGDISTYFEENQANTLGSLELNQENDAIASTQQLDEMLEHVSSHQQQVLIPAVEQYMDTDMDHFVNNRLKRLIATGGTPPRHKRRRLIPETSDLLPRAKTYPEYAREFTIYEDEQNAKHTELGDGEESLSTVSNEESLRSTEENDTRTVSSLEDETGSTVSVASIKSIDSTRTDKSLVPSISTKGHGRSKSAVLSPSSKVNILQQQRVRQSNYNPTKQTASLSARKKQRSVSAAASLGSPFAGQNKKFIRSRSKRRLDAPGAPVSKENMVPPQR